MYTQDEQLRFASRDLGRAELGGDAAVPEVMLEIPGFNVLLEQGLYQP